jgi:hypothetical protein
MPVRTFGAYNFYLTILADGFNKSFLRIGKSLHDERNRPLVPGFYGGDDKEKIKNS